MAMNRKPDVYTKLANIPSTLLKTLIPSGIYQRLRELLVFRAEDENNLHQVPPQFKHWNGGVERIKGYRYPAPGSQPQPKVPVRENPDDIYQTSDYTKDPRNFKATNVMLINTSSGGVSFLPDDTGDGHLPAMPRKRKVNFLAYDPTGLRTQKTATWAMLDKELEKHRPDHLPAPEWIKQIAAMNAAREAKGLPAPMGRRMSWIVPKNYNEVRW